MPIEILQPKRESEVYPRAHKAGVRSTNQMEVRAAGDRGGGFPPGAGAGLSYGTGVLVILDPWGACLRGDVGQDRVPWAGKQEGQQTEGLGNVRPPRNRGSHPWEHKAPHHDSPMVCVGSSESILRDFGIRLGSDTTQQPQ